MRLAHDTDQAQVGKRPEEIIDALYRAGFAVVPLQMTDAQKVRRYETLQHEPAERYGRVVEAGRVRA